MMRTNVYIPEELDSQIKQTARLQKKSKAAVVREALQFGLKRVKPEKFNSAKALLEMAEKAKQFKGTGPRDLSFNHDYYTWGGEKKKLEDDE